MKENAKDKRGSGSRTQTETDLLGGGPNEKGRRKQGIGSKTEFSRVCRGGAFEASEVTFKMTTQWKYG